MSWHRNLLIFELINVQFIVIQSGIVFWKGPQSKTVDKRSKHSVCKIPLCWESFKFASRYFSTKIRIASLLFLLLFTMSNLNSEMNKFCKYQKLWRFSSATRIRPLQISFKSTVCLLSLFCKQTYKIKQVTTQRQLLKQYT